MVVKTVGSVGTVQLRLFLGSAAELKSKEEVLAED